MSGGGENAAVNSPAAPKETKSKTTKTTTEKKLNKPASVAGKAKRHQQKGGNMTISNPGIRRIARRGGVKRVSNESFDTSRQLLDEFLNSVVRDAVIMSESCKRKTVTSSDVTFSLKRNHAQLYGFN
jgi:histone H4